VRQTEHPDGYLFFPPKPSRFAATSTDRAVTAGHWSVSRISQIWQKTLRQARADSVELPTAFVPRKLRATFATAARSVGCDFFDLQRYLGQMPSSVLSQHYDMVDTDRLRKIADVAQRLARTEGG
jgi:integrase